MPRQYKKKFDLSDVVFLRTRGKGLDPNRVIHSEKNGLLSFSAVLVEKLKIVDWENVLVGFDSSRGFIVLKKVDPEEYGARLFSPCKPGKAKRVSSKGIVKASSMVACKYYKPTRKDVILILEPLKDE